MEDVTFIFPHQLHKEHAAVNKTRIVFLIEEHLFFNQYKFHKKKLVLHRAGMKCYADHLTKQKIKHQYIEATDELCDVRKLIASLAAKGLQHIHYCEVTDDWLERRIAAACKKHGIKTTIYPTPTFLNTIEEVASFFEDKQHFLMADFYSWQRKQRGILMQPNGKPVGDKWSFDTENRLRFPAKEQAPLIIFPTKNKYVAAARLWVDEHYADNYGTTAPAFGEATAFYPTNFKEAEDWLQAFLQQRFQHFGAYEDAMVGQEHFLYHSVLTPMLNTGLLTPKYIIEQTLAFAAKHKTVLNSVEGFIRQIMGWREFIRIMYIRLGRKQRTTNHFGFSRKIPASFYTGTTGIIPVDRVIKKVLATGYCHHIERLMVMGNFLLLCEFDPDEVYQWFMEMYIDAYDWVMVPNTYGMTQFADGGKMTTKPYISGSNYLIKMGDWKKGPWQETWDALFWRFMHVHRDLFAKNARLGMLLNTFDKWPAEKRKDYLDKADAFLHKLDQE